ncbi:TIGR03857 family LLM class F420-dependent oxidoreductase [Trujillonella humicola]|uniref:TIGR03857 family LLM class F420-dependent oxidoreductase n=1 Tax=Trujillonella humicola TaxID=3383699 RepID=UPI003906D048
MVTIDPASTQASPGEARPAEGARLGAYILPGRVPDPRPAVPQARDAEEAGLGSVWLSERWGTKDLGVIAGAVGATTERIRIAAGITQFLVRNPAILASLAMTAQGLTDGRFVLGFGRSVPALYRALGLPAVTNQIMIDYADMMRRLFRGEKVSYEGPAGRFPALRLADVPDAPPPPMILAAIGPKTLALAGAHFDGVLLHPFLTPEAVGRAAAQVREGAEQAGRDPSSVTVWATVVTASGLPPEEEAAVVGARAVTYYQIPGFGEQLAEANGWDTAPLATLRAHPQLAGIKGAADSVRTRSELTEAATALPGHWVSAASAVGSPDECAERLAAYRAAGADELLLHGSTPRQLCPVVAAVSRPRP